MNVARPLVHAFTTNIRRADRTCELLLLLLRLPSLRSVHLLHLLLLHQRCLSRLRSARLIERVINPSTTVPLDACGLHHRRQLHLLLVSLLLLLQVRLLLHLRQVRLVTRVRALGQRHRLLREREVEILTRGVARASAWLPALELGLRVLFDLELLLKLLLMSCILHLHRTRTSASV